MKITLLYVSVTGNTETAAGYIKQGICETGGMEARLMNLVNEETLDFDFIRDSRAVVFGTPTYAANMAWQMKRWFDTDWECSLSGKLGAAFATANCLHGGADVALLAIHNHILVKGMLAYSSGIGCGTPFIHLGPVALRDELEQKRDLFALFGQRIAGKCGELFGDAPNR